jgi:hypothetical protein
VIAGWIRVGLLGAPVAGFVRAAGPLADLGFLLGRGFGEPVIARTAAAATSPPLPENIDAALARLAAAGIDPEPFANAIEPKRASSAAADPYAPALAASEWQAMRAACR